VGLEECRKSRWLLNGGYVLIEKSQQKITSFSEENEEYFFVYVRVLLEDSRRKYLKYFFIYSSKLLSIQALFSCNCIL
jgi:hypothetical protein